MRNAESWELVGGPKDGEVYAVEPGGALPVMAVVAPGPGFAPVQGDPFAPVPVLRGEYRAESVADYHARVLRWQGWRT